jgi:glucokinase
LTREGRAVGIDIGGTKIAIASVNGAGEVLREATIPTDSRQGFASGVARITETVARVIADTGWAASDLDGVGIGCAGPVDPVRGTIHNPHTLPGWMDGDIVSPLREAFGCPVVLENDADMALLGECRTGAGRGFDPVVMLTFGTGIGGAAVLGGGLLRGVAGEHPELGHVPVDPGGPRCYCGTSGCFESLASGTALTAAARAVGRSDGAELLQRARAGDEAAQRIRGGALAATAAATWTILHTLLPERLVLGGGMMDAHYDTFAEAVRGAIARATLIPATRISVARAELGGRAGVVGAAGAAMAAPGGTER